MSSRSLTNRHKGKRRHPPVVLIAAFMVFATLCVAGVSGAYAACTSWLENLPDYTDASAFNTSEKTVVYANDRTTVLAVFQIENREPLASLDDISPYVIEGTVATEDERFYEHGAVDIVGIGRAVLNNLSGGEIEGASTITQQLVRNTILSEEASETTLKRKVREAFLAIKMEELYSKDEILLMYLNTINYGSGAYGIEAASMRYFSKSADDLTLSESALLAGIPQSPTYNNPIDYYSQSVSRRNTVLSRMLSNGYISQEEYESALAEDVVLDVSEYSDDGILAYPYFTSYVRDLLLDEEKGYGLSTAEVFKGGLTVYTTIDLEVQEAAERAAADKEASMSSSLEVAMTAIDPDNGYIKAMVGGSDYYTDQYNIATQASRQAGSSFKTFTLVSALEQGISPSTEVTCSASVTIDTQNTVEGYWHVSNINSHNYGIRSISSAFAISSNTGFARLVMAVGPDSVVDVAHRMGITSDLSDVPSITLGSSGVNTLEMADAYATIANGGTHYDAIAIEQVLDSKGNILIDNTEPQGTRVLSEEVSHAAVEVMKGVVTTGTGTAAALSSGQESAGKTGTSDDYKDVWFCGITPQMSVAIWVGDRNNQATVSGTCAGVFSDFLDRIITSKNRESFPLAGSPEYSKSFSNTDLDLDCIVSQSSISGADYSTGTSSSSSSSSSSSKRYSSSGSSSGNTSGSSSGYSSGSSSGSDYSSSSGSGYSSTYSSGSGSSYSGSSSGGSYSSSESSSASSGSDSSSDYTGDSSSSSDSEGSASTGTDSTSSGDSGGGESFYSSGGGGESSSSQE